MNITRRAAVRSMVCGSLLWPGLVSRLLAEDGGSATSADPLAPRPPHFTPKAKRVIFIYATGGVSHIDTFDPKPNADGGKGKVTGCVFGYQADKKTGIEVSDLFPRLRESMQDICVIRSMQSAHFDHTEATVGMHTGSATFTRPSMGSWLSYGLGTFNQNLPSFVVVAPYLPYGGTQVYASDFLPAYHQGTRVVPGRTPIENLARRTTTGRLQELELDLLGRLNGQHLQTRSDDADLAARIRSFETAYHMQTEATDAFDISRESAATLRLYGIQSDTIDGFGWQCLVGRRLAERGVRFIELIDSGASNSGPHKNWDSHGNMQDHKELAAKVDRPLAGLVADLKSRGMLDETLIVWATEFGRTPRLEGNGRGHHGDCYSVWLAGGGIQGGLAYGSTDPSGSQIAANKVDVHDLHATILHLMGIDHTRLTYRHAGRDFRLTDVFGKVVHDILA